MLSNVGYDGDGLRGRATTPAPGPYADASDTLTTFYLYDGNQPLLELAGDGSLLAASAWAADGLRARLYPVPSAAFHDRPLDPDRGITTSLGVTDSVLYSYEYDPQGSVAERQARSRTLIPLVSPGPNL